jgi:hypothetical protein
VDAVDTELVHPAARRKAILATRTARPARGSTGTGAATTATTFTTTTIAITFTARAETAGTNRAVAARCSCRRGGFGRGAINVCILIFSSHLNLLLRLSTIVILIVGKFFFEKP